MRHFLLVLLPGTIAPSTLGMLAATAVARLIAPPGSALFAAPVLRGAVSLTVDVAAIAAGADQHLDAASRAQIEARASICLFTQAWTNCATGEILPRHTCSRTVWGAAPMRTARLESAPCLSSRKTDV